MRDTVKIKPTDRRCRDCGVHTSKIGEYYMVTDEVWLQAGAYTYFGWGMLCIGCLEKRLGRRLEPSDFLDCPLNNGNITAGKSMRLIDRMIRAS